MQNIIITGFMGTGKTEIGRRLAQRLVYDFIDTDSLIEQRTGMSIAEIFARQGEAAFRKMEHGLIDRFSRLDKTVISTGGGMIAYGDNLPRLKRLGRLVCLTSRPEAILKRIQDKTDRPLLNTPNPMEKILELLNRRQSCYTQADFMLDTSDISLDQAAQMILDWWLAGGASEK